MQQYIVFCYLYLLPVQRKQSHKSDVMGNKNLQQVKYEVGTSGEELQSRRFNEMANCICLHLQWSDKASEQPK